MSPDASAGLAAALARALEHPVASLVPLRGGDIARAFRAELVGRGPVFVKSVDVGRAGLLEREAEGLAWLAQAGALAVPAVLALGTSPPLLALEWIEPGEPAPSFAEDLGRGLAALHRTAASGFGLPRDNFIGSLPQPNGARETWARFYAEQRIGAQLRLGLDAGRVDPATARRLEALADRMEQWVGDEEPPSRLHGDLWSGNCLVGTDGAPRLIDPAVYGGHREVDLAMMRLFGGFPERCFEAYHEALPLSPGYAERVPLYQLYPLLVHWNLFGGHYAGAVRGALDALEPSPDGRRRS